MSKKVISILLAATLLIAMVCVSAVSASADETATYYFLAPDEYFATNNDVGYYYWAPEENAAWPGLAMTPAPEVGRNVFKCEAPSMDSTSTIIFNAFVDAGNPADPELAAVAHQTVNINTEGYEEGESEVYDALGMTLDDFNGMIYVLNNNDKTISDFSGAATTGGEWFSIDPNAANYYKNFDKYYGTYNFPADSDTDSDIVVDTDTTVGDKDIKAGDEVSITYYIQNAPHVSGNTVELHWNPAQLTYKDVNYDADSVLHIVNDTTVAEGAFHAEFIFSVDGTCETFASEAKAAFTLKFTANSDMNVDEIEAYRVTADLQWYNDSSKPHYDSSLPVGAVYYVKNLGYENIDDEYTFIKIKSENVGPVDSDTDSDTTSSSTSSNTSSATSSNTSSNVSSNTSSTVTSSNTSSTTSSNTSSTTSSDKKQSPTNASKTTSTVKSGSATGTVATAGVVTVTSLVVILMAAACVVVYSKKKSEE